MRGYRPSFLAEDQGQEERKQLLAAMRTQMVAHYRRRVRAGQRLFEETPAQAAPRRDTKRADSKA